MTPPPALFTPTVIGDMQLAHRVVMAPLTRYRADAAHVPRPGLVAEYYAQRARVPGTLLISEATFISPQAGGYAHVPGIWAPAQIAAWKKVTDAVHARGSFIFLQLWALGRGAIPRVLEAELGRSAASPADSPYVSASPLRLSLRSPRSPVPRALSTDEVQQYVEWYAQAAENAVALAGFDGVEIHGANGYLVDQFLQDVSNKREDRYGGSIENRARFALEVLDAVVKRVGAKKAGLRLSPWSPYQDMGMKDPIPTYTYLVTQILERHPDLAYLHVTEKRLGTIKRGDVAASDDEFVAEGGENDFIRDIWTKAGKPLITAGGYTRETGMRVAERKGDLIGYGRLFISNPDLPYRLREGLPVEKGDRSRYYTADSDPKGYTDYPFSKEFPEQAAEMPQLGDTRSRL